MRVEYAYVLVVIFFFLTRKCGAYRRRGVADLLRLVHAAEDRRKCNESWQHPNCTCQPENEDMSTFIIRISISIRLHKSAITGEFAFRDVGGLLEFCQSWREKQERKMSVTQPRAPAHFCQLSLKSSRDSLRVVVQLCFVLCGFVAEQN